MSHTAFQLWDTTQKNKVKSYCDDYPSLSDSEMVTQLYTQRAIGFWYQTVTEQNSQQNKDNEQAVLDSIALYGIEPTDAPATIGIKINAYVQSLPTQDQEAALEDSNSFWVLWEYIGFITEVQTTVDETLIPEVLASDIHQIRDM